MSSTGSTPSPRPYFIDGRTDAEAYLAEILDGTVVASEWMRRLADMMLPRLHGEYHGFHFDVDKALRPVQFIERFCAIPEGEKRGRPFLMEPWQRAVIELAYGFVDDDGLRQFQQALMCIARKNGKAVSLDTEVPTPDGWRRMRDIHVGDLVFGQDGRPSRVIAESEVFRKDTYVVEFEDGATVTASADHVWTVIPDEYLERRVDMTTEELLDAIRRERCYVPLCEPVRYPEREYTEHPYDVGRRAVLAQEAMPPEYLIGSVAQRNMLLHGIMGACDEVGMLNPVFEGHGLAGQVVELCASLGRPCRRFRTDDLHGVNLRNGFERPSRKRVTCVRRIQDEPTKCIAIDNPSHLYLVGRCYTATHNTSLMSGLGLYHLTSDGEMGAEVYCCATSEPQARKCYGAADQMREMSPFLSRRIRRGMAQKTGRSALNYDKNGSMLVALAANPRKKDGLSASAVIYDELAAAEDGGALFEQLEESMSARRQPMTWIISSENTIRDGIWDERIDYCKGILNGKIEDDRVLPLLYVQDDRREIAEGLEDEGHGVWLKSNPGLFVIKDADKLAHRVRQGVTSPRRMPSVITKDFCLRSGSYSAFLDPDVCVNATPIDFDEIGMPLYVCVGFDLASRNDLCSCVARWRVPGDGRIYELAKFWVASETMRVGTDAQQKDNVPYNLWSERGQPMDGTIWHWVDVVEGDRVNASVVIDFLNDLVSVGMYPYCVAYDPWHVEDLFELHLQRLCGASRCFPVPQTARVISPLMRTHALDLMARKVICPNPCLHHNRSSVQARTDNNDNIFPQKKDLRPSQKIDGFMAELFALAAEQRYAESYFAAIDYDPTNAPVPQ